MLSIRLTLTLMPDTFAICRLEPGASIPVWASQGAFCSITRTSEELSVVVAQEHVPDAVRCERDWKALKVQGPLDFALTGVLASICAPLAEAGVSVFALSTYDTDYVMIRTAQSQVALDALRRHPALSIESGKDQLQRRRPSVSKEPCLICERVTLCLSGQNPHFIHEFEHSLFVIGDHQYHPGYSLILLKDHVRELHELPASVQAALFQEVMTATTALVRTFHPWKMNHACYGNTDEHVHWHLFPRYETLPDHRNHPWLHAAEFRDHTIDKETARSLALQVRQNLEGFPGDEPNAVVT